MILNRKYIHIYHCASNIYGDIWFILEKYTHHSAQNASHNTIFNAFTDLGPIV